MAAIDLKREIGYVPNIRSEIQQNLRSKKYRYSVGPQLPTST